MNEQAIVDRIISDAENEAKAIISEAERKAQETVSEALLRAERVKTGVKAEVKRRTDAVLEGKSASARLDCAKILLGEKRRVIDEVYARALAGLNALKEGDALYLASRLLNEYAEEGDEIVFADNYKYRNQVSALPAVKEKGLKISSAKADIGGGFVLVGKNCDKDVSYGALLSADREEKQADIAQSIFITG